MNTEEEAAAAAVGGPQRGEEKPSQVSSNSSRSSEAAVLSQSSNSFEELLVDAARPSGVKKQKIKLSVRNRSFKESVLPPRLMESRVALLCNFDVTLPVIYTRTQAHTFCRAAATQYGD